MDFDIIFCTYNSEKWIEPCLNSIAKSNYNLKKISLYFYDNNSSDDTVKILEEQKRLYKSKFKNFIVLKGGDNRGFGYANNRAAEIGKSKFIFILNIDTEIFPDTLKNISEVILQSDKTIAAWELRQKPYEHPKFYNPITFETSWASCACLVVKRDVFEKIHGFDEKIFMYSEDVDLSWRIRSLGYRILYIFDVSIIHHSYESGDKFKLTQWTYGFISNMYLRSKFGSSKDFLTGIKYCICAYRGIYLSEENKAKYLHSIRKLLVKNAFLKLPFFAITFLKRNYKHNNVAQFYGIYDYEIAKAGPFYINKNIRKNKKTIIFIFGSSDDDLKDSSMSVDLQTNKNFHKVYIFSDNNFTDRIKDINSSDYYVVISSRVLLYPDYLETMLNEFVKSKEHILRDDCFVYNGSIIKDEYDIEKISLFSKIKDREIGALFFDNKAFNKIENYNTLEGLYDESEKLFEIKTIDRTLSVVNKS